MNPKLPGKDPSREPKHPTGQPDTGQVVAALAEKEYECLRAEIASAVSETRSLERHAVVACAALWTWLLAQPVDKPWIGVVKWIPFFLSVFAAMRSAALYRDVMQHAAYLLSVEKRWGNGRVIGWEHFLLPQKRFLGLTAAGIWIALLLVNLTISIGLREGWFVSLKP